MNQIIEDIVAKFKDSMYSMMESSSTVTLNEMETRFLTEYEALVCSFIGEYLRQRDRALLADKKARREKKLVVQRREDPRQIYTVFGEVRYDRTYYRKAVGYEYPIDTQAGIESYSRMSPMTSYSLVDAACDMSYAKSSEYVTDGVFSKQTVMRKIRESYAPESPELSQKKKVRYLHIDADEDHVSILGKGSVIVPVISVYEGVERHGKRSNCRNVFHISEYGKNSEELWNQVRDEIDKRYDLRGTTIYLHADGAGWISEGLNWLPNVKFVLDTYHKNKAIKQTLSGFTAEDRSKWKSALEYAFATGSKEFMAEAWASMLSSYPERKETIDNGMGYLTGFFDAIHIREEDAEARNGGATEPHVQHVLSYRLSSTPHVWSEQTIRRLAPILASRSHTFTKPKETELIQILRPDKVEAKPRKRVPRGIGLPDPDIMASFPSEFYKRTALNKYLKGISKS